MPTRAIAFMQQHHLHGNILAQFEWGPYVLWHMGDAFKVYIDPRGELVYTDKQEGDYAIFFYGMEGADHLLEAYPHDYVLMGVHTKGADVVSEGPALASDCTAIRPRRFSSERSRIAGRGPVVGNVAGDGGKPADTYFP